MSHGNHAQGGVRLGGVCVGGGWCVQTYQAKQSMGKCGENPGIESDSGGGR